MVSDESKYEQLCGDHRALNTIFWQAPLIIMTLTGGLWFSVANFELSAQARSALLWFCAAADLLMIAGLIRLRFILHGLQREICALDARPPSRWKFIIVILFAILLGLAAFGSAMTALHPDAYFLKQPIVPTKGCQ